MMGNVSATVLSVIGAIVGLAIVAVLVSQKANTANVLKGAGSALSGVISAAVGPVTGGGGLSTSGANGTGGTAGVPG